MKFHYLKKFIYITEIVNAHYFGVHIPYFGSDLLITTTVVKFHYFTFREIDIVKIHFIHFTNISSTTLRINIKNPLAGPRNTLAGSITAITVYYFTPLFRKLLF